MLPVLGAFKVFRLLKALGIFGDKDAPIAVEGGGLAAERPPPLLASPQVTERQPFEPGHHVNGLNRLNL
jgi:hypothetical protein